MGIISKGHCPCGYESEFLYEGCGMMGPATSRSLVYCDHCQEMHSILSSSMSWPRTLRSCEQKHPHTR